MKIRVVIADDEPLARERIRSLLSTDPEIEVCAECGNGLETVEAVREFAPELIFLDIQMPELDGFGVIEAVGVERMPTIIFVTAFDQYAIQAFDAHALDYLLKPYDRTRFYKALQRAKDTLLKENAYGLNRQLIEMLGDLQRKPRYLDRLVIKSTGRIFFLKTEEIDWIGTAGNYLEIHSGEDTHLIRETMNHLENRLDPAKFLRIHRCTMVNLDRIQEIQPYFANDYIMLLKGGAQLTIGRKYREKLHIFLENHL